VDGYQEKPSPISILCLVKRQRIEIGSPKDIIDGKIPIALFIEAQ
jgi:hypothetical protein